MLLSCLADLAPQTRAFNVMYVQHQLAESVGSTQSCWTVLGLSCVGWADGSGKPMTPKGGVLSSFRQSSGKADGVGEDKLAAFRGIDQVQDQKITAGLCRAIEVAQTLAAQKAGYLAVTDA